MEGRGGFGRVGQETAFRYFVARTRRGSGVYIPAGAWNETSSRPSSPGALRGQKSHREQLISWRWWTARYIRTRAAAMRRGDPGYRELARALAGSTPGRVQLDGIAGPGRRQGSRRRSYGLRTLGRWRKQYLASCRAVREEPLENMMFLAEHLGSARRRRARTGRRPARRLQARQPGV